MNTFDTYFVQEHYERRHACLAQEMREARVIQAQITARFTQALNWLGTRFIAWGEQLQGAQGAKIEWTH